MTPTQTQLTELRQLHANRVNGYRANEDYELAVANALLDLIAAAEREARLREALEACAGADILKHGYQSDVARIARAALAEGGAR